MAAAKTTKKVESKGKVDAKVKTKVTTTKKEDPKPTSPPSRPRKREVTDLDSAVEGMMAEIDENEYAGSTVARSETVDFYKGIIVLCRERIEAIQGEMEEGEEAGAGDSDDDVEIDDDDGDPD